MHFVCIFFAVICDIAAIQNGDKELYRSGEAFSVTGHVISVNTQSGNATFWNKPHSFVFRMSPDATNAQQDVLYRLDGHLELWKDRRKRVLAERLVPVETNVLPVPVESTAARIAGDLDRYCLVRIEGIAVKVAEDETDSRFCWLTLKSPEGTVATACLKQYHPLDALMPTVGAKVRLVGVLQESGTWRSYLPPLLVLSSHNPIEIVEHAEKDPEKLPKFTSPQVIGRQRTEGTVVVHTKDGFYMRFLPNRQGKRVALVHPAAGVCVPAIGESVVAAGFAALDGYHLRFDEAIIGPAKKHVTANRDSDEDDQQVAAESIPRLFTDESGHDKIAASKHGRLVRITGTVRDLPPASAEGRRIVIEDGGYRIGVDAELISANLPDWIENDAVIEATGMLVVEYEPSVSAYALPRFRRFTILPRTVDDIRLVRRAPWWTPRRLLMVILALLGVIVWFAIWNRALKRLSVKRGEELYRERIAHKAAELKVEERTRLAVEIHDSISQTLTGIALQFDTGADEAVVRQMLASCRHELKSCLWDLRSRTFEEKDMTEAVKRAIGPHAGSAKVDVRFNVPRSDLSETTTHAILRIVRELVVNAVRHGKATEVKIAGESHDGMISFSVRDNGTGFDPMNISGPSTGHFGLQGIRERIAAFKGEMTINTSPGKGTKISIVLKVPEPSAQSTSSLPSRPSRMSHSSRTS